MKSNITFSHVVMLLVIAAALAWLVMWSYDEYRIGQVRTELNEYSRAAAQAEAVDPDKCRENGYRNGDPACGW